MIEKKQQPETKTVYIEKPGTSRVDEGTLNLTHLPEGRRIDLPKGQSLTLMDSTGKTTNITN